MIHGLTTVKRHMQLQRNLTASDRQFYLKEIKLDIAYYRRTYKRAHLTVDIAGWSPDEASLRIKDLLMRVRPLESLKSKTGCR
jgi:hypothetical protein